MNSTRGHRIKEWKSRSCIKKGFLYQLTPCVNCADTTSPTCTDRRVPSNYQCVVLRYAQNTRSSTTNCSTYPIYCSVDNSHQQHFVIPPNMNSTGENDFCLADRRSRKFLLLIVAPVVVIAAFICFNVFCCTCRPKRRRVPVSATPSVISDIESNEQNRIE